MGVSTLGLKLGQIQTDAVYSAEATTGSFRPDGVSIPNGLHLIGIDDSYDERRQVTVKTRTGQLDPKTGSFAKDKRSVSYAHPTTLADGKVVFNTIRVELEVHPSANDLVEPISNVGAQLLTSPEMRDFWKYGSVV